MKQRILCVFLAVLVGLLSLSYAPARAAGTGAGQAASRGALPTDQIIVRFKPGVSVAQADPRRGVVGGPQAEVMQRLSSQAGAQMKYVRPLGKDEHVMKLDQALPAADVAALAKQLMADPGVAYAEPDLRMMPLSEPAAPVVPDDPYSLWSLQPVGGGVYGIDAVDAWNLTKGSDTVRVAVIDTGIRRDHEDLVGRTIGGYDFISDTWIANDGDGRDADPSDPGDWVSSAEASNCGGFTNDSSWHGSHVTGTIAAIANNQTGITGINWVSKVVPVRVLGKCGGYDSDISDAMRWAAGLSVAGVPANPYPARVLSLSLGGSSSSCPASYQSAIQDVNAAGAVVVVAAGNDGGLADNDTPANCSGVITVGATMKNGYNAPYSNTGSLVEISAPGGYSGSTDGGILSTIDLGKQGPTGPGYAYYMGTSMATPHVSGIVSLMLSVNPSLTPAQVTQILQSTASPFPASSPCATNVKCGSGIANAYAAVSKALSMNTVRAPGGANGRGYAGPYNAPVPMTVRVTPTGTLSAVSIGGRAAIITKSQIVGADRVSTITPPTQAANGAYNLAVTIDGVTTTVNNAVLYGTEMFIPAVENR